MIIEDYVLGVFVSSLSAGIWIGVAAMFMLTGHHPSAIVSLVAVLVFLSITYVAGTKLIKFHDNLIEFYATTTYATRRLQ